MCRAFLKLIPTHWTHDQSLRSTIKSRRFQSQDKENIQEEVVHFIKRILSSARSFFVHSRSHPPIMYTSKLVSVFSALIGLSLCQTVFPEDNHTFKLVRAEYDLAMDLDGGLRDEGAPVSQYNQYQDDWGMFNQQWHLISGNRNNPTAFRIRNVRSNTYLTVADGSTDNGAYIGTWERTGFANQTWFFQPEGDGGLYRFVVMVVRPISYGALTI